VCKMSSLEAGESAVISFNARLWNRTISEVNDYDKLLLKLISIWIYIQSE
jgi:hypothetical protein